MSKGKLIPKLRFTNYRNEINWQPLKLEDIGSTFNGLSGKTKKDFGHGNAEFVTYMNVFNNTITDVNLTEQVEIDKSQDEVQYGDVFFTTSSETPHEVGMSSMWLDNRPNVYLNSFCFGFRPLIDLDYYYFAYMLKSPKIRQEFIFLAQGISRYNISKTKAMKIPVWMPNKSEQEKIGKFFHNIDQMIQLQQSKVNKVKDIKSAYLSEMFPKEGEKYPKKRFEGFIEPWEQVQVQEIFRITRGYVLSATKVTEYPTAEMKYPVYSSQTKKDGLMGYYNDYLYENSITWTTDGANAGTVSYRPGKFYCTNVSGVLISNEGYANKMVAEALNQIAWKHVSKVGNPKLMNNIMAEIVINIPQSIKEQNKISQFIINLDNQIAIEEDKLDKLEKLKQAYLNDMFV